MNELMSIEEATVQGIKRLRKPIWGLQEDHIEIDIVNNVFCFWVKFYSTMNMKFHGRDPIDIPFPSLDVMVKEWIPYIGITPESDEYKIKTQELLKRCGNDGGENNPLTLPK